MKCRILLADDHQIVLDGLSSMLAGQSGLEVIGHAHDGHELLKEASELRPDVAVVDISMPNMNGIEATHRLRDQSPGIKVLCLSMHSHVDFVLAMLQAGAAGYLLKEDAGDLLLQAIRRVMEGQSFLSPGVTCTAIGLIRHGSQSREKSPFSMLSNREREVLQLIAEGKSTRQIAELLHVSGRTIGSHRENLKHKLGISSIAGLTRYALQHGLTSIVPLQADGVPNNGLPN